VRAVLTPTEIESQTGSVHFAAAMFGHVSRLDDAAFLEFVLNHRDHKLVRRTFFSEIQKRTNISFELIDKAAEILLQDVIDGHARVKNEALLRRLFSGMSMQTRVRTVLTLLTVGTRQTRNLIVRWTDPTQAPGVERVILDLALSGNEDALVGVIYRWPPEKWKDQQLALFSAAHEFPWLQRQLIFRGDAVDEFLQAKLIDDPVTELYVRAKYRRTASDELLNAAITSVCAEGEGYEHSRRIGLVAWCLGHFGKFKHIAHLPMGRF
jgi:hypothetical protein